MTSTGTFGAACTQKPGGRGGVGDSADSTCRELSCDTPTAGLCANGGDMTEGNGLLMQERAGMIVGETSW